MTKLFGCPQKLAQLIRQGVYDPALTSCSELKAICEASEIFLPKGVTKVSQLHYYIAIHVAMNSQSRHDIAFIASDAGQP